MFKMPNLVRASDFNVHVLVGNKVEAIVSRHSVLYEHVEDSIAYIVSTLHRCTTYK